MRKSYLLIAILLLQYVNLFSQQNKLLPFKINGTINANTGTIELRLFVDPSFYPENLRKLSTKVENKKFYFSGYIPSPQGFELLYNSEHSSSDFIIEAGTQSITFNIDSGSVIPRVQNVAMREDYNDYINARKLVKHKLLIWRQKEDTLNRIYQRNIPNNIKLELGKELDEYYRESDKKLLNYVKSHPNSYVALWKFINLLSYGYESVFDSIFDQFSESLKNTYAGNVLSKRLKIASMTSPGKQFPSFSVVNNKNEKFNVFKKTT